MSIAAMIASIKFNDRRNKREAFSHLSGKTDYGSQGVKVVPVSEEVLEEIRIKMKKQKARERKQFFVFLLIGSAFVLFLSHQISELNGTDVSHFFRMFKR